ncbi:MAG: radical SAM protein [Endomicrobiales bacterium]
MEHLLEEGKKLSQAQRYDEAAAVFCRLVTLSPGSAAARFELGKVYFVQGKNAQAREELLQALQLDPATPYPRVLLAKIYRAQGASEQAIGQFEKLLESGYAEENIARELATVYRLKGEYEQAYRYLLKAKEGGFDGEPFEAELRQLNSEHVRLVQQYNFEGRYNDVVQEAQRALGAVSPDDRMRRNGLLNEVEIARKKLTLDSRMRSLTFTLTNQCNLRCLMCETRKTPWNLPDRVRKEVITLFPYIERVMWQGGEAFLYEGFEELLDEASKYPIRQVLATNGMLITDAMAEKLVKYNVELTFSIDGATKEVYEHIRPGATFEKVLGRVNLVNELRAEHNPGMRTRLNVLVMRANYRQIEEFIEFAHRYRFSTLFFNSAGCDFKNLQENVFYYNHDPEIMAYINQVRDSIAAKARDYGVTLENWLPSEKFFEEMTIDGKNRALPAPAEKAPEPPRQKEEPREERSGEPKLFCHAPWQRLYIDCGGKVRPDCLCLVDHYIGNLHEKSLMDLWNGEEIMNYRRKIIAGDFKGLCNPDCVYGRVPKKNLKYI